MFIKLISVMSFLSLGLGVLAFGPQGQQEFQKDTSKFMARKLDGARDVVAGLATEDYALISKSAQNLMLLSHEADWKVFQTQAYLSMSSEFRDSAGRLRDSALGTNLDGATLAYFEVTLNCVRCHKYVRQNHDDMQKTHEK